MCRLETTLKSDQFWTKSLSLYFCGQCLSQLPILGQCLHVLRGLRVFGTFGTRRLRLRCLRLLWGLVEISLPLGRGHLQVHLRRDVPKREGSLRKTWFAWPTAIRPTFFSKPLVDMWGSPEIQICPNGRPLAQLSPPRKVRLLAQSCNPHGASH